MELKELAKEIQAKKFADIHDKAIDIMLAYASSPNVDPSAISTVYREVFCMLEHGLTVKEYLNANTPE